MPMKEWMQKLQPIQLYVILVLTVLFFITELAFSHLTHALTLLLNAYHMLCNIMALTGCLITIKYSRAPNTDAANPQEEPPLDNPPCSDRRDHPNTEQENKLKNTFGWARIDVMSMLMCCIFLASCAFLVVVEALQTLGHMDHSDAMHHPIPVLCIGAAGLVLNGVCYLLIGGYTFHQGSFLYVTEAGDVVLTKIVVPDMQQGGRRLSRTRRSLAPQLQRQRQGMSEISRDVTGCLFVIASALLVYFTDEATAKYVDPALAIVSSLVLLYQSYPHFKESCLILLQTIPGTMDINELRQSLLQQFPSIVNVHDFHLWQLTATKIITTVHIIFENHGSYVQIKDGITNFFTENGITQVTVQPEFYDKNAKANIESIADLPLLCLMQCEGEGCKLSHCCPSYVDQKIIKGHSKEMKMLGNSLPDLRAIRVITNELSKTTDCLTRTDTTKSTDQMTNNKQDESIKM